MRRIILLLLLPVITMTVKGELPKHTLSSSIIPGGGVQAGRCPSVDLRETALQELKDQVKTILSTFGKDIFTDCQNAFDSGRTRSGIYTIQPDDSLPFQVYCDMETDGGGWTVFQRRQDGSVNFDRNWTDYENGFGDLNGEFWLGLSYIHRLTTNAGQLRVDLGDFEGNTSYAKYTTFQVMNSTTKYRLSVGGYSGTAGDSLAIHNGQSFSTRDREGRYNCARQYKGGWWYNVCHKSNLNGLYHGGPYSGTADGVDWSHWRGFHYSLKFTEMKLR